jgi:hypothetical protein
MMAATLRIEMNPREASNALLGISKVLGTAGLPMKVFWAASRIASCARAIALKAALLAWAALPYAAAAALAR